MAKPPKEEKTTKEASSAPVTKSRPSIEEALGTVTWLLLRSPVHKFLFLSDMEWLILPPLQLMQFRIFRDDKRPLGYVSWAFVDEATEQRLLKGVTKLAPKDWRSGDRVWIVDVVAPFGGAQRMLQELAQRVFKERDVKVLRPRPDAKGLEAKSLKEFLESLKKTEGPK